jgi:uncharacterized protein YndB with AHSA1/START domain
MTLKFSLSETFPTTPEVLYQAWLDSETHSQMTGATASVSDQIGAEFTAWDGYIKGKNLELQPPVRIVQAWRTSDFQEAEPDSILEITFLAEGDTTRVTVWHSNLPEHGQQYRSGWVEAYFDPMKEFFSK